MNNLLDGIEEILLMGPGPSCVPPTVYEALAKPTLGHLDPYFLAIMDGAKSMLQELLNTKNALTVPMSGTGSAGMEACFVNLVEPGDPVLVLTNGVFAAACRTWRDGWEPAWRPWSSSGESPSSSTKRQPP
jgi:alanine-glyoxylate transaminase/serine-glyoxylate transaminase/serine-pyruvate transaminase